MTRINGLDIGAHTEEWQEKFGGKLTMSGGAEGTSERETTHADSATACHTSPVPQLFPPAPLLQTTSPPLNPSAPPRPPPTAPPRPPLGEDGGVTENPIAVEKPAFVVGEEAKPYETIWYTPHLCL